MRWLAPVAMAIGIFAATSWPTPPPMPGQRDKVVHFLSYALLGAAVAWAADTRTARRMLLWVGAATVFGAVDEWHQHFIPGRRTDVRDWLADTAGAVTGFFLVTALVRRREAVA